MPESLTVRALLVEPACSRSACGGCRYSPPVVAAQVGAACAALSRIRGIKQVSQGYLATVLVVQPGSVVLVVWMPCSSQVEQSSGRRPAQRDLPKKQKKQENKVEERRSLLACNELRMD